jgi:hypothetical protein
MNIRRIAILSGLAFALPLQAQQVDVISRELTVQVVPDGPLDVVSREVSVQVVPAGPLDVVSREVSVQVPPLDLVAVSVQTPATITAGTYLDVVWSVSNVGGVAAVAPWTDALILSTDAIAGNGDDVQLWAGQRTQNLLPTLRYGGNTEVWIPVAVAGPMFILLQVDTGGVHAVLESTANNVVAFPVQVAPFPGTVITGPVELTGSDPQGLLSGLIIDGGQVTMDGKLQVGSLILRNGGSLTHSPGSGFGLDVVVFGDARIDSGASINVSGKGYPGGTGPGAGAGGAGHGGAGANLGGNYGGEPSGSLRRPRSLGSGGGQAAGGGPGGGAVHLRIGGQLELQGVIAANGGGGGGAGGSVWIEAADLIGAGEIAASGSWQGGGGRVAIDCANNQFSGSVFAHGNGGGAAGTHYQRDSGSGAELVVLDNHGAGGPNWNWTNGLEPHPPSTYLPSRIEGDLVITGGARLSYPPGADGLYLTVVGHLMVDASGCIHGFQRGMRGEQGFDSDPGGGYRTSAGSPWQLDGGNCGAGHAGVGGEGSSPLPQVSTSMAQTGYVNAGGVYDLIGNLPGSGGARYSPPPYASGGNADNAPIGGGLLHISAGSMHLDGGLIAPGASGGTYVGAASGGSIRVFCSSVTGTGVVDVSGGNTGWQLCHSVAGAGGGGVVQLPAGFAGVVDVSGGRHEYGWNGCFGLNQQGGNGVSHSGGAATAPLPAPLSGSESFDSLSVGSAPDTPNASASSTGRIGAWRYPFGYPVDANEAISIVASNSFDPSTTGNSLAVVATANPSFAAALLDEGLAARPNGVVRFEGRVWAGPGLIALGNGTNGVHAEAPVDDLGPTVEWLADGRIVAWVGDLTSSVDLVVASPQGEWHEFRMDVDLSMRTFDFWWAATGQALQMVASDVGFVSAHSSLDRIVVGNRQGVAADMRVDDLTVSDAWCHPSGMEYGTGTAGLLGVPAISLAMAGTTELVLGNVSGAATIGAVVLGSQPSLQPLFGGSLLVVPNFILPTVASPAGATVDLLPRVVSATLGAHYLQWVHYDPAASQGWAMSRGLVVTTY